MSAGGIQGPGGAGGVQGMSDPDAPQQQMQDLWNQMMNLKGTDLQATQQLFNQLYVKYQTVEAKVQASQGNESDAMKKLQKGMSDLSDSMTQIQQSLDGGMMPNPAAMQKGAEATQNVDAAVPQIFPGQSGIDTLITGSSAVS